MTRSSADGESPRRKRRLKGSQEPRIRVCPEYADTYGDDAADLAEAYGLKPDPWQRAVLRDWCARDPEGQYAASTAGLSVPRQNGKTAVVNPRELYGLTVEGERILHTAHEVKTCAKQFEQMKVYFGSQANDPKAEYPELNALVKRVCNTNGREGIYLRSGASIEFSARSRGAGRGFTVDVVVCDEAQELTDEQLEALLPTSSAGPLQNSQLIMLGTPPSENAVGDVFGRTRKKAIAGLDESLCWHEWSVETVGDVRDESRWEATNPGLGRRITRKAIEKELSTMSDDGFARERLGWWREGVRNAVFEDGEWSALATDSPPMDGRVAYGVKFSADGAHVSIAAAIRPQSGKRHVEVVANRSLSRGTQWLADWLAAQAGSAVAIVVDGKSGAQALADKLLAAGVPKRAVTLPGTGDAISAYAAFEVAVTEGTITHFDQPALNLAVRNAQKRKIGSNGGFGFQGYEGTDVSPLEACCMALWGVMTSKRDPGRRLRVG